MAVDRELLIKMLSERSGYDVATPHGAERLQKDIETATGERLSVNTLKRILGIIPYFNSPRSSTLEILSRYLNFSNQKTFTIALQREKSDFSLPSNFIDASLLPEGCHIAIEWAPNRKLKLRHLAAGSYIVEKSVNSKLAAGDKLLLGYLSEGYPFIVKEVIRNGVSLGIYTAAVERGLSKVDVNE